MMMKKLFVSAATAAGLLASTSAFAQTVQTVNLTAQVTVETGCAFNGGVKGEIDSILNFGTVSNAAGTTVNVDGSTLVADGGTSFTIECNNGLGQVTAEISGGANDLAGVRRMAGQSAGGFVPYRLYSDAARSVEYTPGNPIVLFGNGNVPLTTVAVYGRILPADIQSAVPDLYIDTPVTMNITF
jgi:spore coat protein U-like protein